MISAPLSRSTPARLPALAFLPAGALASALAGCSREQSMDVSMVTGKSVPRAECVVAALKAEFPTDEIVSRDRERIWVIVPKTSHSVESIRGTPISFTVDLVDRKMGIAARVHTDWSKQSTYTDEQRKLITGYPERALNAISTKCLDGYKEPLLCGVEKADGLCPK